MVVQKGPDFIDYKVIEAEKALLEGYETLTAALGSEHVHTRKALLDLAAFHEAWGKPEKAE